MSKRNYTDKQQAFLDALPGTKFDIAEALKVSGHCSSSITQVVKSLREEIIELAEISLAGSAGKAALKLQALMESDKPIPQGQLKLAAAQSILDRVGVSKRTAVDLQVVAQNGIFILPAKDD